MSGSDWEPKGQRSQPVANKIGLGPALREYKSDLESRIDLSALLGGIAERALATAVSTRAGDFVGNLGGSGR